MKNDLVIGAVTGYTFQHIEPWLVSLERSGYRGHIALIAYNINKETVEQLRKRNVIILAFEQNDNGDCVYERAIKTSGSFNIVVTRFFHMWYFLTSHLSELKIDRVIATDVRDVIFQTNPSFMLDEYLTDRKKQLLVGSENFRYKDEPWSKNNISESFGALMYEHMKNYPIYCAGVIAGEKGAFLNLCLNVSLYCQKLPPFTPGGGGPDQSAMNLYLANEAIEKITTFATTEDSCIIHAGTSVPAMLSGKGDIGAKCINNPEMIDTYRGVMLYNDPVFLNDLVCNSNHVPYAIVHQYDRVNEWKDILDRKYRE